MLTTAEIRSMTPWHNIFDGLSMRQQLTGHERNAVLAVLLFLPVASAFRVVVCATAAAAGSMSFLLIITKCLYHFASC